VLGLFAGLNVLPKDSAATDYSYRLAKGQHSEVRLNVNLDVALTVMANGCCRWLSQQLKGCEKMEPKQLYRKFVETGGHVAIESDAIHVHLDRRAHNPVIAQAQLDKEPTPIPWLEGKKLRITCA